MGLEWRPSSRGKSEIWCDVMGIFMSWLGRPCSGDLGLSYTRDTRMGMGDPGLVALVILATWAFTSMVHLLNLSRVGRLVFRVETGRGTLEGICQAWTSSPLKIAFQL